MNLEAKWILDFHKALKGLINNYHCVLTVGSSLKRPSQETNALRKDLVLNNSHLIFLFWHLGSIKEKSREDFITRSIQCVKCNPQVRNKELIYCISGSNASEKQLDLQIN